MTACFDHEDVISALFAHLIAAVTAEFTATGTPGQAVLTDVSSFERLFEGLPVFGEFVPKGAEIVSLDAEAGTIELSEVLGDGAVAGTFTTGFLTTGRRVKHWSLVAEQPAFFLRHIGDSDDFGDGEGLGKVSLELEGWLYSRAGDDPAKAPDICLNKLARLIRMALAPDDYDTNAFTLGGKVHRCRIEGRSDYDPGDQDAQGKAVIPIIILLP